MPIKTTKNIVSIANKRQSEPKKTPRVERSMTVTRNGYTTDTTYRAKMGNVSVSESSKSKNKPKYGRLKRGYDAL